MANKQLCLSVGKAKVPRIDNMYQCHRVISLIVRACQPSSSMMSIIEYTTSRSQSANDRAGLPRHIVAPNCSNSKAITLTTCTPPSHG
eukprot:scaffold333566_cov20-Prasinocladus_malaysianus.AAC.1